MPRQVENVIMMISTAVFNIALAQKENKSFTTYKDQSETGANKYACFYFMI